MRNGLPKPAIGEGKLDSDLTDGQNGMERMSHEGMYPIAFHGLVGWAHL